MPTRNEREWALQSIQYYTDARDDGNTRLRLRIQKFLQRLYVTAVLFYVVDMALMPVSWADVLYAVVCLVLLVNFTLSRRLVRELHESHYWWTRQILRYKMIVQIEDANENKP